jgi:hypothetical protein
MLVKLEGIVGHNYLIHLIKYMFSYREGIVKRGIKEVREERRTKFLEPIDYQGGPGL